MSASVSLLGRALCPVCGAPSSPGSLTKVPACEFCGTRLLRWWIDDLAEHHPGTLPELIASWRERMPEHAKWPRDPRRTSYEEQLEETEQELSKRTRKERWGLVCGEFSSSITPISTVVPYRAGLPDRARVLRLIC